MKIQNILLIAFLCTGQFFMAHYSYQTIHHFFLKNAKLEKSAVELLAQKLCAEFPEKLEVCKAPENHPDYVQSPIQDVSLYFEGKANAVSVRYWQVSDVLACSIHHNNADFDTHFIEKYIQDISPILSIESWHFDFSKFSLDNPKIIVQETLNMGKGLFAVQDIAQGEFLAGVYGRVYQAPNCSSLPDYIADHTSQFAQHLWRTYHPSSNVTYFNHSCEPNCAPKGHFDYVAIRDIKAGEQLFLDYACFDDSDWQVPGGKCLCGVPTCRGIIMAYHQLPEELKIKYRPYLSPWIVEKYKL